MFRSIRVVTAVACLAALQAGAAAQFNNQWASFANETGTRLGGGLTPVQISNNTTSLPGDSPGAGHVGIEVDFGVGDLDKDGWTDVVVVRKQPFTTAGKRTNLLLMNESGVLFNRTALYASAADVVGDQGFLTPTNDRDVVVVDVDNDCWLDVVTAVTVSDGDPKHIGHPRVYMNRGDDPPGSGNWLGLRFENARFPQLFHFSNGNPENPRFISVAAGDVTGDGYVDLYFGDHDSSTSGGVSKPAAKDLNDRLLVNNGNGFFTDESQLRMTPQMLISAFATAVEIADMNGDGVADIVKSMDTFSPPKDIRISYNNPSNVGFFNLLQLVPTPGPYHLAVGDLNRDGKLDLVITDDGPDHYRLNQGNDALGRVTWSAAHSYEFLSGGDDGFGGNIVIADLDGDGWNDTLHADVDADIPGCNRRMHIYHNRGGTVGGHVTLREERQSNTGNQGMGWLGAVGLLANDLRGTHDVAVLDLDNDGDLDMLIGKCTGTHVWMNQASPVHCQLDLGYGGPGSYSFTVCGEHLWTGNAATLELSGTPPFSTAYLVGSLFMNPSSFKGGLLVPMPILLGPIGLPTGPSGTISFPLSGGGGPLTLNMQWVVEDPATPYGFGLSNALEVYFLP